MSVNKLGITVESSQDWWLLFIAPEELVANVFHPL